MHNWSWIDNVRFYWSSSTKALTTIIYNLKFHRNPLSRNHPPLPTHQSQCTHLIFDKVCGQWSGYVQLLRIRLLVFATYPWSWNLGPHKHQWCWTRTCMHQFRILENSEVTLEAVETAVQHSRHFFMGFAAMKRTHLAYVSTMKPLNKCHSKPTSVIWQFNSPLRPQSSQTWHCKFTANRSHVTLCGPLYCALLLLLLERWKSSLLLKNLIAST